ncbi:dimethylaniline monooxygenase, N-oxide-forming [Artemisia annua]|uniref:Dimethylaniline monooxygenase, N-oxide-forming n=1 Tax=Artemisia annua TaxID=35608 RepID=A0A2U1KGK5_ARTAN|nr:dimethylaniline monooxygenase, N-oxide-forming [Artemisia annua]
MILITVTFLFADVGGFVVDSHEGFVVEYEMNIDVELVSSLEYIGYDNLSSSGMSNRLSMPSTIVLDATVHAVVSNSVLAAASPTIKVLDFAHGVVRFHDNFSLGLHGISEGEEVGLFDQQFYEVKTELLKHPHLLLEEVSIYATGFNNVEKLKCVFETPKFGHYIVDLPRVPPYRRTIPTRITHAAAATEVSDGLSCLYTSRMSSRW